MSNIRDVAHLAGVSITTVSKVISNTPYVSAETRARVEEAIKTLHYKPNLAARSLLRQQSFIAAMFIPYVEGYYEIDPYLSEVIRGAERELGEHEYSLLLSVAKNPGAQQRATTLLESGYADGILTVDILPSSQWLSEQLKAFGIPAVANGYPSPRFDTVVHANDKDGARQVIEYLLGQGHRRIAIIAVRPGYVPTSDVRLDGVRETLAAAGYPLDEAHYLTWGNLTAEAGKRGCQKLLEQTPPPTAIYTFSDRMALGALQQARMLGIAVPEQLSIVGNDDISLARLSHPALTTVEQPLFEIGQQMASRLLEKIQQAQFRRKHPVVFQEAERAIEDVFPAGLLVRDSSGPAPAPA